MTNKLNYKIKKGTPMPLGTMKTKEGINFAMIVPGKEDQNCSLILYKKGTLDIITEVVFSDEMRFGKVYAMCIQGLNINEFDYNYRVGNKVITDPYAQVVQGNKHFGQRELVRRTSAVYIDHYNWDNDVKPEIEFSDSIIYRLNVRSFTMGKYSKVKKKGTFKGISEKIGYLKELGITMIELMPAYEFDEIDGNKVDLWGYRKANYFMPKIAYSSKKEPKEAIHEFKNMVAELHRNGLEICMEFYFEDDVTPTFMLDCFRYWVINFHIDGIHCNMKDGIRDAISADPYLARTKIISYGFDSDEFSDFKHLGECNTVFMRTARKFLKGDEGQVQDMAFRIRYNKTFAQSVNYIANNDTFTMMDMLSYERKHNEKNAEYNRDGASDNYSWNCGYEGDTKRRSVVSLRTKQYKNAVLLLMLSQGTPMIYAGDEFGNSCDGNNNPYCQDNDISYLDWRLTNKNKELLNFMKEIIQFRKEHKILHLDTPMQLKDYHSMGMPDMSFHSDKTWSLEYDVLSRQFGVMLYGKYCDISGKKTEENIYIGYNMHWEEKTLGLPTAGKNKEWYKAICTVDIDHVEFGMMNGKSVKTVKVPARSIVVLLSRNQETAENGKKKAAVKEKRKELQPLMKQPSDIEKKVSKNKKTKI